jgi:ferredoxin-NADP reductase
MKVFFVRREELAPAIWQYYFRPERRVDFVAGQYVSMSLKDVAHDLRGSSRTFTLTSLPSDNLLSFVVKIPPLHTPYKNALVALAPGSEAKIGDAMGDLVLPKSPEIPLVYIAGGIGMASYASMLKQLLQTHEERSIFLFYALRSRYNQIFRDLTASYSLKLKQTILAPNRLTAQEIIDATPPNALVYLSGSQNFVEGLCADLTALGTPHEQIVFDYYDGYIDL